MSPALELPKDTAKLQELALSQHRKIRELNEQLEWFKRQMFGRKSEKRVEADPQTLDMFGRSPEPPVVKETITYSREKKRPGHGRNPLPEHLEVVEEVLDVPEDEKKCGCCGRDKGRIGEDVSSTIEMKPVVYYIKRTVRPKYACANCKEAGVSQVKVPKAVFSGTIAGTSLILSVILAKYLNHMPLERQSQDFKRQRIDLSPSTMVGWINALYHALLPLYEIMRKQVLTSRWAFTDDTGLPVQIKRKKGKTHRGIMWVYIGERKTAVFEYTHTRSNKGPLEFLKDFEGYLHADCYTGYDRLYQDGSIRECACWSHGRRNFFDAKDAGDVRAERALTLIGRLFLVERYAKSRKLSEEKVKAVRQRVSKPVLASIERWMKKNELEILPECKLGKAISHLRKNWKAYTAFTEEGFLSIDNNISERQLRKVVLGRNNWYFCGSENAAKRSALLYSFVCTCKLLGIDPYRYLQDVVEKLPEWPLERHEELTPEKWAQAHPLEIS